MNALFVRMDQRIQRLHQQFPLPTETRRSLAEA